MFACRTRSRLANDPAGARRFHYHLFVDEIVDNPPRVALLGLGEAGSAIAADLIAAGAAVSGRDPAGAPGLDGLYFAGTAPEAVAGATVVLSVNWASAALEAAAEAAPALAPGAVFADLNTAAPRLKEEVAAIVEPAGARFADVALLSPVPGRGLATPAMVSGSGAAPLVAALSPLGAAMEALGPRPGEAAERKLLRSVFVKGMTIAAMESIAAARAAGCEEWLREHLEATVESADAAMLERLVAGSRPHARRRTEEMRAAAEMLDELGTRSSISAAAADWYEQLAKEGADAR
jgi:3-hydroxyisobutyrate dehydrogenase-like beta-hydroxyacid dehydrogenase